MSVRKKGQWKARAFQTTWMGAMGRCECCGEKERFVWRKCGYGGSIPDGTWHDKIHRISNLELDHVIPLHLGGSNDLDNLQLLCTHCHKTKTAAERTERARRMREDA